MGGDSVTHHGSRNVPCFNPRPRMGGDRLRLHCYAWPTFQSTPPHGGRLSPPVHVWCHDLFQSTPPHGGRRGCECHGTGTGSFNPRPRMGGDISTTLPSVGPLVSIHAPAWGATIARWYADIQQR